MFVSVIKMLKYGRIDISEELTLINQINQKMQALLLLVF